MDSRILEVLPIGAAYLALRLALPPLVERMGLRSAQARVESIHETLEVEIEDSGEEPYLVSHVRVSYIAKGRERRHEFWNSNFRDASGSPMAVDDLRPGLEVTVWFRVSRPSRAHSEPPLRYSSRRLRMAFALLALVPVLVVFWWFFVLPPD